MGGWAAAACACVCACACACACVWAAEEQRRGRQRHGTRAPAPARAAGRSVRARALAPALVRAAEPPRPPPHHTHTPPGCPPLDAAWARGVQPRASGQVATCFVCRVESADLQLSSQSCLRCSGAARPHPPPHPAPHPTPLFSTEHMAKRRAARGGAREGGEAGATRGRRPPRVGACAGARARPPTAAELDVYAGVSPPAPTRSRPAEGLARTPTHVPPLPARRPFNLQPAPLPLSLSPLAFRV